MTVPFTDDELREAQTEARRLLAQLVKSDELDLADLIENGWVRDAERNGRAVVDSRAWALIVAFLELTFHAIDHADRVTRKMHSNVYFALEKARPSIGEARFHEQFLSALGCEK
jgi:hypothetical protein